MREHPGFSALVSRAEKNKSRKNKNKNKKPGCSRRLYVEIKDGCLPYCLVTKNAMSRLLFSASQLQLKDMRAKISELKWYYDQKIISFFSSDFESVFA